MADVNAEMFIHETIRQFPHCDPRVLHGPGECQVCDKHKDWQALRELYGINFTGHDDPEKDPCPSTKHRPLKTIYAWGWNRPQPSSVRSGG